MKRGSDLKIGDILVGSEEEYNIIPSGPIQDVRPRAVDHPLTISVQVGGQWYPLAHEGRYETE